MKPPDGKWWDQTYNPVSGCTPVSAGCENCWAKRMHDRHLWGGNRQPFSEITLHHDRLEQPLRWRKPRRVAVCLMGDLFHPDVPYEYIVEVFHIMYRTPQHFYFVLTKRSDRMVECTRRYRFSLTAEMRNIGLGISAEDQATADERIPHLLECPAAIRFISVEPMLGPISFPAVCRTMPKGCWCNAHVSSVDCSPIEPRPYPFHWVIIGSESGPGARPMDLDWVRSIRDQCVEAGVPLWFKQQVVNGKRINMPELDGVVYDQMPEVDGVALREEE